MAAAEVALTATPLSDCCAHMRADGGVRGCGRCWLPSFALHIAIGAQDTEHLNHETSLHVLYTRLLLSIKYVWVVCVGVWFEVRPGILGTNLYGEVVCITTTLSTSHSHSLDMTTSLCVCLSEHALTAG